MLLTVITPASRARKSLTVLLRELLPKTNEAIARELNPCSLRSRISIFCLSVNLLIISPETLEAYFQRLYHRCVHVSYRLTGRSFQSTRLLTFQFPFLSKR